MDECFKQTVLDASQRPEVRAAIQKLYRDLQREIDQRRPVCLVSGRCCRFDEFGHRLYVTTMELASFIHDLQEVPARNPDPAGCPFQLAKLCSVHAIRPFGCRLFFCDATSTQWQNQLYEQFHSRLKRLHEEFRVPYSYMEWRDAIRLLN